MADDCPTHAAAMVRSAAAKERKWNSAEESKRNRIAGERAGTVERAELRRNAGVHTDNGR